MPRIDIQLINRKIKLVSEDLAILKKYKDLTLDEYLNDPEIKLIIERLLEIITGQVIDINYHILKEEYESIPTDYYNSFINIAKNKIITEEFAEEIAKSAGLRNALAHNYDKIDDELVFNSIKIAIIQIPQYLSKILEFLK
ncbi:MAG: hypothetical protein UR39_C0001G0055 [Candidatus Woesebacteria bacterium GW2011_GWA1_33_30]|uniref:DUF86 domain-containing protein n=1 Tax=Candidatus Woesebacteria bacterium GW2011_GWA2_33_28 TaxID=1618561 RepID=A0A0G0CAQ1_9BACT|nr:MAG: hypothetical protein UR38_C0001G0056 [Candidatus Woesebacteria bacterium GW2011_GWA2_33_28]KKP49022.1 MAG: hypothetical protein UR39_C0001G0055 [Candidatus Woesebacteria bacterium GW2011_GWA1_33_30]KKP49870.1 MAG: hypothetical protein UR40_C0003G0042 [Microgenomates group bacterium GW2011_GWC1_33_32]KKP52614.1 MAG: hypothetical protein UR44_C0001G0056 [Candidatus Woesebacteria bacterium GW2011_GWB1_33_38]KKP56676.1 MAG: hypothetical protein UR48_C0032G0009 [Microgenomates group bacteriu